MPATKRKGTASTTRLRKAECVGCGYTIRVTRKWLGRGLPTCVCGGEMRCPDPADHEWTPAGEEEWRDRDTRKVLREARAGHGGAQQRCSACHAFTRNAQDTCPSCGYTAGIGYLDAAPTGRLAELVTDDLPF